MTKLELEELIRTLIRNGDEYDRLELKSSYDFNARKNHIRLVKCIAAIANTDSPYFEGMGYIVLGAKRGDLVGGFNALEKDSTTADMHGWVGEYIDPVISFSVERFRDKQVGWWGVIVIPPSSDSHVFKREFRELSIRNGDIYVRHGDSITLADKTDHDRLQRRKFTSTFDNLENEIKVLKARIEEHETQKPELKLYFLDDKKNRHESLEVQPVFWEKTKEQLEEEASNEASINTLEKELEGHTHEMLTTHDAKKITIAGDRLREELTKRKALRYENQLNDPIVSRIIELNFILSNDGNSLATGINAYIYFPDSLELSVSRKSFQRQVAENPHLDQLVSTIPGILAASSFLSPRYPPSPPFPDIASPKYSGPEISEIGDQRCAKYWIDKLLQHHGYYLDPIYFVSPENNSDIEIPYKVYAENVPGVMQGTLQLNIRPKSTR